MADETSATGGAVAETAKGKSNEAVAGRSLAATLWERARRWSDRNFGYVREGERWQPILWRQLADDVRDIGKSLIAAGVERGDRVALLSGTRYEWTVIDYAILSLGAVTVPIYQTSSAEEVEYILNDCGARMVFCEDEEQIEKLTHIEDKIPSIERIILIEGELPRADRWESFSGFRSLGEEIPDGRVEQAADKVAADDVATYIYTSGTTGDPKGCIITNHNFVSCSDSVQEVTPGLFSPTESTLLFLPLAHGFARMVQFTCVETGMQLYYGNIKKLTEELKSAKPTFFISVPRMFEKAYSGVQSKAQENPVGRLVFALAKSISEPISVARQEGHGIPLHLKPAELIVDRLIYSKVREGLGGRIKYAISGGAALAPNVAHFFNAAKIPVLEGYGLTETSPAATLNPPAAQRIGTVGKPLPGVDVEIGDDGEVLIRGENIFKGYYNDEEKTAEVLKNGWFHSGDVGELDRDGYLRITGRKKDLIITAGGKNIAPQPVEDKLKEHRLISQAVMIGDARPYPVALVTVDPDETKGMPSDEIHKQVDEHIKSVNSRFGRVEQVKKFKILDRDFTVEAGEITPTLKVKRGRIAKLYADEIGKLYL